ncbi:chloride channel protein [bacterium]|nr:chloride channel protein [bacterium]
MPDIITSSYLRTRDFLKIHENFLVIILAAIIGVLAGYSAIGFRHLIDIFQGLSVGHGDEVIDALKLLPWYYKLLLPSIGGLIVGPLIYFFAQETKSTGVPEVMESVAHHGGRIRPRIIGIKALASAITLGTGGSVGREGPIVHIGSSIGSLIGKTFNCPAQRVKTLVACGAAAGIASTFNAPITGVLFSLEIILGNFAIHTFSPMVVASVLATVITRHHIGDVSAFIVPKYELRSPGELILYLILGLIIAWIGLLFMRTMQKTDLLFDKLPIPEYLKTSVGMFGVGMIIIFFPHCFGNGYETITLALQDNVSILFLLLLIPMKTIATSLSLGAGGSGGILAPSLFLGAVTGGAFGKLSHAIFPNTCATSGAYAMVGMGAMLGAVTHAPFTAIITLFELTGDYQIILPMMLCCIFATIITSSIRKDSIFTAKLTKRGVRLNPGLESAIMNQNTVREIMHIHKKTLDPELNFESLYNMIIDSRQMHHYVVGADGMFLGEIDISDMSRVLSQDGMESKRKAIDLINPSYASAKPDSTLMECVQTFALTGVQELPVLDPKTHHLLGIIDYRDVFKLYSREILREGTLGLRFVTRSEEKPRNDYVNLPEGYIVESVPVLGKLTGRSIQELDLRNLYNVTIVAIRTDTSTETSSEIPRADRILSRKDALIIVGDQKDVERLCQELV